MPHVKRVAVTLCILDRTIIPISFVNIIRNKNVKAF